MRTPHLPPASPLYSASPAAMLAFIGLLGALLLVVTTFAVPGFAGMRASRPDWLASPVGASVSALDPEDGAILVGSAALRLAQPCSRSGPSDAVGLWEPTRAQILQLEADLAPLLEQIERTRRTARTGTALTRYRRQYVGLALLGGEHVIYVTAFAAAESDTSQWRHRAFMICDGGENVWAVEYDPTGRRFRGFAFNGDA